MRTDTAGAWHHVMNRGAGRRVVFRDDGERLLFLDLVGELEQRFGLEVHCFCLMGNHYHLLVRSTEGRLSQGLKWLGSCYTKRVNMLRSVDGAIFRGRFHSVPVERDAHLTWLFGYVNANPHELGWTLPLAAYPWSGLAAALGERSEFGWLRHDVVRSQFGEQPQRLELFVEAQRGSGAVRPATSNSSFEDVAAAASIARAPGPVINSDAAVRAAVIVVAVDEVGLDVDDVSVLHALDAGQANRAIARARTSAAADPMIGALVHRIVSVLAMPNGV